LLGNRVLGRIFGPERNEIIGCCTELHNEEIHKLQNSQDITTIIQLSRILWAGHVACRGKKRNAYSVML
jgi:hypothetical protein